ncbi:MAG: PilZ domain-containing protein [Deltaproteobacteria bacterium]|nr:PilZ domain-containing protein [Deltaproteobacteria bacterium]
MKQYTSKFLKTVALGYMAFPVLYILLTALFFDIPAKQVVRILLHPLYYLLCIWAVFAGYGIWEMKRWGWHVFLFCNILIVFSVIAISIIVLRLGREIKVPYFLPKIRWWESNPRYRLSVPVSVSRKDNTNFVGEILDLSMGGCFIKLRSELYQDETLSLEFTVFGQTFRFVGNVVWRTQSTVTHPKGIGIKFAPIVKFDKKLLKAVIHRLKKITGLYSTARYLMNQEELTKRIEELRATKLDPVQLDKEENGGNETPV